MISSYRKLIAAVVGLAILLAHRQWGVDLLGTEALFVDLIISVATAVSVWAWPNDPED